MPHVYICYYSTDNPNDVERLARQFRERRIDVLAYNRSVPHTPTPAQNEAIRNAKALILLIGRDWLRQLDGDGFLQSVLADAIRKRKPWIIPAFVRGADIPDVMDLPPGLRDFPLRNAWYLDEGTKFARYRDSLEVSEFRGGVSKGPWDESLRRAEKIGRRIDPKRQSALAEDIRMGIDAEDRMKELGSAKKPTQEDLERG